MNLNYLIIDDFIGDPFALRKTAKNMVFEPYDSSNYFPGRNAKQKVVIEPITEAVSLLVGHPLRIAEQSSHGKFRLALQGDTGKGNVHIDNCHWSGILYLTLPEYCRGGTHFYSHKASQLDRAPLNHQELQQAGLNSFDELWDNIILKDSNVAEAWQETMFVPMRFNRLVLFRPWLFHNAGESFGTSIEDGRLIYPLFFNEVR